MRIIGRLQRLRCQGDIVIPTLFWNHRCQDYPVVPALQAVPLKTAKPLSNVPVMPQRLLHLKKKASGLFPSQTWMAPMGPVGPMNRRKFMAQAITFTQATATMMVNRRQEARPISDQLLMD